MSGKVYSCTHCGKQLTYKPVRLYKNIYGAGRFKQYYPVEYYNLCKRCYKIFDIWINQRGGTKNGRS